MIDYVIVGAGFAGSVCAERLAWAGHQVLVIDRRSHIGGNAYDEYDNAGILVHRYGAHVFHTNSREVWEYLSRFTAWRPYEHRVLSHVNGQLLPVPINQTTLESFGGDEHLARQALYEPYTRKQWGPVYADHLSSTVLARVKVRADREDRYFTDTYQAMPLYGYTRMFQRMLDSPQIRVWLEHDFGDLVAGQWPRTGLHELGDPEIIYTGPIDEYFGYRFGRLPYRSARFELCTLAEERHQLVGVVNYPAADVPYTRVIEFKHLTGQEHPQTTIAYEYPQAAGEPYWPVPTAASAALYQRYEELARQTPRVHFVGRLGTYRYLDIHQVVAQALKLCATLTKEVPCPA